jgi:hypothetical protein
LTTNFHLLNRITFRVEMPKEVTEMEPATTTKTGPVYPPSEQQVS